MLTPLWYWSDRARVSDFCMLAPSPVPQVAPIRHTRRNGERDIGFRFGRRLRELRKERGMTQTRLADEFGIDRSYLSDIENGKKSMRLATVEVVALGFKISLSELLRGL